MERIGFFTGSLKGVLELGSKVDSRVWGVSELSTRGLLLFMGLFYRVPLTGSVRALQASIGRKNLLGLWGFEQSMGVVGAET